MGGFLEAAKTSTQNSGTSACCQPSFLFSCISHLPSDAWRRLAYSIGKQSNHPTIHRRIFDYLNDANR